MTWLTTIAVSNAAFDMRPPAPESGFAGAYTGYRAGEREFIETRFRSLPDKIWLHQLGQDKNMRL